MDHLDKTYQAALYIRLSKEDENKNESESVVNQRLLLQEYTENNGISIYDEYIDAAVIITPKSSS